MVLFDRARGFLVRPPRTDVKPTSVANRRNIAAKDSDDVPF